MKILEGDIFKFADSGEYDVIIQGCNCFSTQGAGIAVEFVKKYHADTFSMELEDHLLNYNNYTRYNKLGCIDYQFNNEQYLTIVNCYTQYYPGKDARLWAIGSCFRKLDYIFTGQKLLLPAIGCGLGGLDRKYVMEVGEKIFKNVDAYWVEFK